MPSFVPGGGWYVAHPAPPDEVLRAKLREVGEALGWSLAHDDRSEGLFIWRLGLTILDSNPSGATHQGAFSWYVKRVGNELWVDDAVDLHPIAGESLERVGEAVRRLQEEFKRRWLGLVGPVTLRGPIPEMHSREIHWPTRKRPASACGPA
jgi:hypothetical protein